ncbi:MAG: carbon-nitrogen hydrolase family protein [Candidatus Hodarchaeales archaeon]|jgi:predicted amidohydrolase
MTSSGNVLIISLQPAITLHDLDSTLQEYDTLLEEHVIDNMNPDIICFPEYWNGLRGNMANTETVDKSINFLKKLSKKYSMNIVGGSIATPKKNKLFNQSTILNSKGKVIGEYNKHALFGYEKTQEFSWGKKQFFWNIGDFRASIRICSDLWNTKMTQDLIDNEIDLLFVPALTVVPDKSFTSYGRYLWHNLALIRAKECATAVIVSDSAEASLSSPFWTTGSSIIVDPSQKFTNSDITGDNMTVKLEAGQRGIVSKKISLKEIREQKMYRKEVGLLS